MERRKVTPIQGMPGSLLRIALSTFLIVFLTLPVQAGDDDFGIWSTVGVEKKINSKWSVGGEAEWRTRNNSRTSDRWSVEVFGEYKVLPCLKAAAGYKLIDDNFPEKISIHTDGTYNNWRPSYWGVRHRFHVSLTGGVDWGNFKFSCRECWQYTYRSSKTTNRYDFDNAYWEDTDVSGKGGNVLRSRFQVDYNIPQCKVDPYVNVELFNAWSVEKVRYTAGLEWKVKKKYIFEAFYRYQKLNGDDSDNEPDSNILGLGYKFKF